MNNVDIVETDLVVIGGGFAGTWAALRAAELGARVVLLDKAYVSRSGASTMSGGVTNCPLPGDDLREWAEEFVTRGHFMCDQRWTLKLLEGQRQRVQELAAWGVPITREPDGSIRRFSSRGMVKVRCMHYGPKQAMEALRRECLARGVQIVDRFCTTELLTTDGAYPTSGAIAGAFGFNTRTGRCTAYVARRTVLATGMLSLKGIHHIDNDTGDGVAMAWRAGARLADLEFSFGGTFTVLMKRYNLGSYNVAIAHGAQLLNRHGERFMHRYDPVRFERSELSRVVAAFVKEIADGNGPVSIDLRQCGDAYWELMRASTGSILLTDNIPDPRQHVIPIEATWGLWNGGQGGVAIDLHCRASLEGLLAAGSAAKNPATGTHASAGAPTAFAMNSGYFAGESAAREAAATPLPEVPAALLERLAGEALAPLHRKPGAITADHLHDQLSRIAGPITEAMDLNHDRLVQLDEKVALVSALVEQASVDSVHDLVKVHEARNICENLRLVYQSADDRTESRESFYRSDFPDMDNDAWFCEHAMWRTGGKTPAFARLPFPTEGAMFQNPHQAVKKPSQIAAIFAGNYDPVLYD